MALMVWTKKDDDTVNQCRMAVDNSRRYAGNAMPWFGLCVRMYQTLADNGMLKRVEIRQVICRDCVWEAAEGGCAQHFEGAHMDCGTGEVRFCPRKMTSAMRESQMKRQKRRSRA